MTDSLTPSEEFEQPATPETAQPCQPDSPGLLQSVVLIGLALVLTIAVGIGELSLEALEIDVSSWSATAAANVVGMGLVVLWAVRRTGLARSLVLPFGSFPPLLLLPLLLFALGCTIVCSEIDNLVRLALPTPEWLMEVFLEMMNGSWESFVALVVVAPLTEELLFRGVILRGLIIQRGVWSGILWSAFLFAAFHLNPWQFVAAFPVGIALGWLFVRSGSLWPCILLHAAFNSSAFLAGAGYFDATRFSIPGFNSDPTGPVLLQPLAFDALGFALLAVGIVWMTKIFDRAAQPASA